MKWTLMSLLALVVLASCASAHPDFRKIEPDRVHPDGIKHALNLADQILAGMDSGNYFVPGEESSPQLRKEFTAELQEEAYYQILAAFGHYESMEFHSAYAPVKAPEAMIVYRFKGNFEHGSPEVRVTLSGGGKLSGIWVKPWHDALR